MAHTDAGPVNAPGGLRPGTLRGTAGFFRVGQDASEKWWLLDPAGEPFFCRAVHGVRGPAAQGDGALPPDSAARLRAWGFNSVGVAAGDESAGRDDGLPFLSVVDFCATGALIIAPGVRLPDVFHPEWATRAVDRAAEVCAPFAECREVIGWVTDAELAWAPRSPAGRPSLLQICLSLEPNFAAYHAAWEFVLALHGGRLGAVARAWNAPLPNKEVVRELTRAEEGLGTRGYLRDDARWTREIARRYFTSTSAAVRAAARNHLVFGCSFRGAAGHQVLAECVYPTVDVSLPDWSEVHMSTGSSAQPMLANNVCWVQPEFLQPAGRSRAPRRLTSVERMLKRARTTLDRLAHHPAVVGYAWAHWQDEPGEQPPFARGLVHVNGVEAREHVEVLAAFNARAEMLRRTGNARGTTANS